MQYQKVNFHPKSIMTFFLDDAKLQDDEMEKGRLEGIHTN